MEIVFENYPPALEWLKKTGPKNTFSGSFSKSKVFTANTFCYRIWSEKNAETEERELHTCCWIKPALARLNEDRLGYAEGVYPFSQEGLDEIGTFLKGEAEKYIDHL